MRNVAGSAKTRRARGKDNGLNHRWFVGRIREALEAAEHGRHDTAVDRLDRLATQCRQAVRDGLTEWHEIQALGLLGVELERRGAHAKAAAVFRRIADVRRGALQESGHGLAAALAAAAVASLRAGKRTAGRKLAIEAIGRHGAYPVPKHDFEFLQQQLPDLRFRPPRDVELSLLTAWRTNNRVTIQLIEHLPRAMWDVAVPGAPQRTIRSIAAHLHNARCRWVKTLGSEHGIAASARVDHHRVTPRQLVAALKRSSTGIEDLLKLGFATNSTNVSYDHRGVRFPAMSRPRVPKPAVDRRVALLRGVNVGTAKRVSMAKLRKVFEDLGYDNIRTLLNSGNVVFTIPKAGSRDHAARVQEAIFDRLGIHSRVVVFTRREIAEAVAANPLTSVVDNPSRLLVLACADANAVARLKPLLEESWAPEALALGKRVAYLWCAKGIGVSRLWTMVNRTIGDAGTARNATTMSKLLAILDE